jgi:DNA-binding PucR family transcriptional regulator
MDVQKAYNQTTAIYGLRGVVKDSCNLWFYIDYTLLHMADLLRASHDLEDFVHPYILDIYRYDRENETDYLPTLKEYLTNINNPGQCAANLHIHKNTLYYRINKISDVFGLDLSNGELRMRLQLSLELLKLNSFETGQ